MEFVINHYLVAWSCHGMCDTKLKYVVSWSTVMSCRMLSCRVVSHMCELVFAEIFTRLLSIFFNFKFMALFFIKITAN